jgi:hypothetical protein
MYALLMKSGSDDPADVCMCVVHFDEIWFDDLAEVCMYVWMHPCTCTCM